MIFLNFLKAMKSVLGRPIQDYSYIIRLSLFREQKPFILIEIAFCDRNENKLKDLLTINSRY